MLGVGLFLLREGSQLFSPIFWTISQISKQATCSHSSSESKGGYGGGGGGITFYWVVLSRMFRQKLQQWFLLPLDIWFMFFVYLMMLCVLHGPYSERRRVDVSAKIYFPPEIFSSDDPRCPKSHLHNLLWKITANYTEVPTA